MGLTQEESIFFLGIGALETISGIITTPGHYCALDVFLVLLACVGIGFVVCLFCDLLFVCLTGFGRFSENKHRSKSAYSISISIHPS